MDSRDWFRAFFGLGNGNGRNDVRPLMPDTDRPERQPPTPPNGPPSAVPFGPFGFFFGGAGGLGEPRAEEDAGSRDWMLKEGGDDDSERRDSDLDEQVKSGGLAALEPDQQPSVSRLPAGRFFRSSSFSSSSVTRGDGSSEERTTTVGEDGKSVTTVRVRDRDGNETVTTHEGGEEDSPLAPFPGGQDFPPLAPFSGGQNFPELAPFSDGQNYPELAPFSNGQNFPPLAPFSGGQNFPSFFGPDPRLLFPDIERWFFHDVPPPRPGGFPREEEDQPALRRHDDFAANERQRERSLFDKFFGSQ